MAETRFEDNGYHWIMAYVERREGGNAAERGHEPLCRLIKYFNCNVRMFIYFIHYLWIHMLLNENTEDGETDVFHVRHPTKYKLD